MFFRVNNISKSVDRALVADKAPK